MRRPINRYKWIPPQKAEYTVYYFSLRKEGEGFVVEAHPEAHPEATNDNVSLLVLDQVGAALQITWLSGKPAPETDERNHGLLAILSLLTDKTDGIAWGIGHAHSAKAHFDD
ncbi:MAG: hypothetical protein OHK0046_47850 [Anaerolineae bacterium]